MQPKNEDEDTRTVDELHEELVWDEDEAVLPDPEDDGDMNDRAFGREY